MKELAIGEVGEIDGVKVRCVTTLTPEICTGCCFLEKQYARCSKIACQSFKRKNGDDVIFEAVTE